MRGSAVVLVVLALAAKISAAEDVQAHWERVIIAGGSELLTLFSALPGEPGSANAVKVPILSVSRDTMGDGDPDNDRLRYVWLLVDEKQNKLARWLTNEPDFGEMPAPIVDLSAPATGVWK